MKSDCTVARNEVLAVVLSDVSEKLTHPVSEIADAIAQGGFGDKNISKDFLTLNDGISTMVLRGKNCRKRKCVTIRLDRIDQSMAEELKRGSFKFYVLL